MSRSFASFNIQYLIICLSAAENYLISPPFECKSTSVAFKKASSLTCNLTNGDYIARVSLPYKNKLIILWSIYGPEHGPPETINLYVPEYCQPGTINRKLGKRSQLTHTLMKLMIFLNQSAITSLN